MLRDGTTTGDRRLDRLKQHDPRSAAYPIRALLDTSEPRSYTWPLDVVLDQGREGACVGFSISHELRAKPRIVAGVTNATAQSLYKRAQELDPWPGSNYSGTSVLAGVKAAQEAGYYAEYRWASTADELAVAVSRRGPAVLGINWHESMYDPERRNDRHWLTLAGPVVGGHAILCRGYSVRLRAFCLHNSWGPRFGDSGRAWISHFDMAALLAADGEAVIPVVR